MQEALTGLIGLLAGRRELPAAWHAHLPVQIANAVDKVSRYTEQAPLRRSRTGRAAPSDLPGPVRAGTG